MTSADISIADDDDDLEPCSGGCGDMVRPDPLLLVAWCGQINCAAYEAAYQRAEAAGARV